MDIMANHEQSDEPLFGPLRPPLTARERHLMFLTLMGQTPAEMAVTLGLSPADVQLSLEGLWRRFGVADQRRLLVRALLRGWRTPPH